MFSSVFYVWSLKIADYDTMNWLGENYGETCNKLRSYISWGKFKFQEVKDKVQYLVEIFRIFSAKEKSEMIL
jgi:hypothetical protein